MFGHMGGGWFWLIFIVMMILVVGFFAMQTSSNSGHIDSQVGREKPKRQSKSARAIADERYARGEISREEYLTIIRDIERDHATG